MLANLVHNFALGVDAARDVYYFFTGTGEGNDPEGVYNAGYGSGRILYYIIVDDEFSGMVDPAEGMDLDPSIY